MTENSILKLDSITIEPTTILDRKRVVGKIKCTSETAFTLWFEFPSDVANQLKISADPFLPPMIVYAMLKQKSLEIDPTLSDQLLNSAKKLVRFYSYQSGMHGPTVHQIPIKALHTSALARGRYSAAFFSGGVDSFYTLLKNLRRYPQNDPQRIQYLITVHGFDIALDDNALYNQTVTYLTNIANKYDLTLIPVTTNLRTMTDIADWTYYGFGPGLASVGLALQPLFHTIYIPASAFYAYRRPTPFFASHPSLDPLWSTESVEFVHDGIEARRIDKVELISKNDDALQALRVCWRNPDGKYNCGVCEKCLRTMVELRAFDALHKARHFPSQIDLALIKNLKIAPYLTEFWEDAAEALTTIDPALSHAIYDAIQKSNPAPSSIKQRLKSLLLRK